VEVTCVGLDVGRHFGVDRVTLAVGVQRHTAVFTELGLLQVRPCADVSHTEAAQKVANMLER
jgi:hypothetical protein